jgi:hypothetical protein
MADDRRRYLAALALLLFLGLAVYDLGFRSRSVVEDRTHLVVDAPLFGNRVVAATIYHEADDELVLDVDYVYTGHHGRDTFIGAMTLLDGASTGHWSYVPAQILPGQHTARLDIRINEAAPETYHSDAVVFEFYEPGESPFYEQVVALNKRWRKER